MIFLTVILACVGGTVAYTRYYHAPATQEQREEGAAVTLQPTVVQQQEPLTPPPPPSPTPSNGQNFEPSPEPSRTLIGETSEHLRQIEQYLPEGAQIATYPIGETHLKSALINADLDGDGVDETVVVFTATKPSPEEGTLPLTLGILSHDGAGLSVRSLTRLAGGVLFEININGDVTPLAALDITGDGRPEIIAASGSGASAGGRLQAFSTLGASLRKVADIGGHFFRVHSRGAGQASMITARWKDERETATYEWNGQKFEQVNKNAVGR
jgi:hypothetical protein